MKVLLTATGSAIVQGRDRIVVVVEVAVCLIGGATVRSSCTAQVEDLGLQGSHQSTDQRRSVVLLLSPFAAAEGVPSIRFCACVVCEEYDTVSKDVLYSQAGQAPIVTTRKR